ncbi:MAG: transposase domain-containing protein [Gammaproteobacteria bacterium]
MTETTKANRIEPHRYLGKVFTELPTANCHGKIEVLLPDNMGQDVRLLLTIVSDGVYVSCLWRIR